MRTVDLIPFILIELKDGDKYGIELSKNIESKFNGEIEIKQPTLYTVLKKLEKSKFISSFWKDSDIGGKRHYYKLTDNGKLQLSTLPPVDVLINEIKLNENAEELDEKSTEEVIEQEQKQISVIDLLEKETFEDESKNDLSVLDLLEKSNDAYIPKEQENILPSDEVFASTTIDTKTELEINKENVNAIKENNKETNFAENNSITTFTSVPSTKITEEYKSKFETHSQNQDFTLPETKIENIIPTEQVEYLEYKDIKKEKDYIRAKNTIKALNFTALITSAYLILSLIICAIVVSFTGTSPLFYVSLITSLLIALFYPVVLLLKNETLRLKVKHGNYTYNSKLHFFIATGAFLAVLIACIIVNIAIGNNSLVKIFAWSNFSNIYAPLLLSLAVYINFVAKYNLLRRINN